MNCNVKACTQFSTLKKIILVSLFFTIWLEYKYGDKKNYNLLEYTNLVRNDIVKISSLAHNGEINFTTSSIKSRIPKVKSSDFQMPLQSKTLSNVPEKLIANWKPTNKNNCAQPPTLMQIKFNNIYWQVFNMTFNEDLFLYSAYYDNRLLMKENPLVRIFVMSTDKLLNIKIYCQIWYDEGKRLAISEVFEIYHLGFYNVISEQKSYLLSCRIPGNVSDQVPSAVSLVEDPCDLATNLLRVVHNVPIREKRDFAVCVKGLSFPYSDMSKYLVEWIEIHHILGVDKIFIYEYDVHPNISKVLQYYRALGWVEVIPLTIPGFQPNFYGLLHSYLTQKRATENEKMTHNDCFYMNMYQYKYIGILDSDEVIIPRKNNTWKELINYMNSIDINNAYGKPTHYTFERVISLDSMRAKYGWEPTIPKHMYMLQNIYRTYTNTGLHKSIVNPSHVINLFTHHPLRCDGPCTAQSVPKDVGIIWHYRRSCRGGGKICSNYVNDTEMYRFKDELIGSSLRTLKELNLI